MDNLRVVSKYGYSCVLLAICLFLLSWIFSFYEPLFALLALAAIWVYRNPERMAETRSKRAILAPIDGVVEDIKKSAYNGVMYSEIVIRNRIWDCGVLRGAADLDIEEIRVRRGLSLFNQDLNLNLLSNRVAFICANESIKLVIRVSSGVFSKKINYESIKHLRAGERFAFIKDGRVSLFVPLSTRLSITKNRAIKASELIGYCDEQSK